MRKSEIARATVLGSNAPKKPRAKKPLATPPPPGSPITPEQIKAAEAYLEAKRAHDVARDLVFYTSSDVDPEGAAQGDQLVDALYDSELALLAAIMGCATTDEVDERYEPCETYGMTPHSRGIIHGGWLFLAAASVDHTNLQLTVLPLASVAGLNGKD
jgi:hypothetical protein